jgi:pimeloyl-ACP methyl ester carboxylesterase
MLLHGAGLSPMLFDPVVEHLGELVPDVQVVVPLRAGYVAGAPQARFADMVHDVIARARSVGRALLVGVSGGATLALAALLTGERSIVGALAHEPLIGPLAPELHRVVSGRAALLATTSGVEPVVDFVAGLVGSSTWATLPEGATEFVMAHHGVVRHEVPEFVGFTPTIGSIGSIHAPLTVSTGERSGPERHAAAAVIAGAGSPHVRCEVVPDGGHLACWQRPADIVRIVRRHLSDLTALEEHL